MNIIAIDPGYRESAIVVLNRRGVQEHAILGNVDVLEALDRLRLLGPAMLVIEEMQLFSQRGVGKEVFDSVFWSGRFAERWMPQPFDRLIRAKVRAHLCHTMKAGDPQVRAALIDRFGPFKETAVGKRAAPGPLFGIRSHEWSALALAVTYFDFHPEIQGQPHAQSSVAATGR